MPSRINPPLFPLRPADSNSKWLADGLILSYPILDGNSSKLKNYGSLGAAADLNISGATHERNGAGLPTLRFSNPTDVASNTSVNFSITSGWAYAYWIQLDSTPTLDSFNIFSLQGFTEAHIRSWVDVSGIWSWQKRNTADTYSFLPPQDYPTTQTMLVFASYEGGFLPQVQLRTKQGPYDIPRQPNSYGGYNEGQGQAAVDINGIFIGNSSDLDQQFPGTIGPLYFWDRPLSESEIWQMWQDPYAPFRRSTEQKVNFSTLRSSAGNNLQGTGKLTDVRPIIQDDEGLFINILDNYSYVDSPEDLLVYEDQTPQTININDTFAYDTLPTEDVLPDTVALPELNINIAESFSYLSLPSEALTTPNTLSPTQISLNQGFSYVVLPSENITGPTVITPAEISITENYSYQTLPSEDITITVT